jgi:sialic acid synthase SpsE
MQGPDHILSSEPDEMIQLVQLAKMMPKILGDGIKKIQPNEYVTLNAQRRSIYSKCFIKKDEIITEDKIIIKGPGGGLLPKYFDIVIGRTAKQDIEEDHPIKWENI